MMFALRRPISSAPSSRSLQFSRAFHASARPALQTGDPIPDVSLMENSPGNKVSLARELQAKNGLIVGVPAAFSPSCSSTHIPAYIAHPSLPSHSPVFVISVNDAFVMKAWANSLDPDTASGIRFLADPHGEFTRAVEMLWDGTAIFGNERSKRYAIKIERGRVAEVFVEPDNTGVDVSAAANVLGKP